MSRLSRGAVRFHVAAQIIAALVALAAANYLGFEYYLRADFSRSQKFALSTQTKRIFRELKSPLKITVFFSRTSISPVSALFGDVQNLLDEYVFSGRKRISVEFIDPVRDLTRAREAQAAHKFRADENVLVLEYDGRTSFLPVSEMADFDLSPLASGGKPELLAFKGEAALSSAILALVSPEKKRVYLVQGHGEPGPGPDSPITTFSEQVGRLNLSLQPLDLATLDHVPRDASAVIITGPQSDFSPREVQALETYWNDGGRLLVLLDPDARTPALDGFLAAAGLRPRGDRVLRLVGLGFATGILREVTADFSERSPITKRLAGLRIFLPGATQSIALEEKEGVILQSLISPLEEFWGEADHRVPPGGGVRYDDGRDAGQPLSVAASASRGGVEDDRLEIANAKLVVVGNSQFALDAALTRGPAGLDFLVSSVSWLVDRGNLAGAAPKVPRYFSVRIDDGQLALLALVSLVAMPLGAGLLAIFVWVRRRSG